MKNISPTTKTGNIGEDAACRYLKRRGYRILERNVRYKLGELDIVARSPDRILALIEVKTTIGWNPHGIRPEDQMTFAKLKKFRRAASCYVSSRSELIDSSRGFRLDLMAVFLIGEGGDNCHIRHYENI